MFSFLMVFVSYSYLQYELSYKQFSTNTIIPATLYRQIMYYAVPVLGIQIIITIILPNRHISLRATYTILFSSGKRLQSVVSDFLGSFSALPSTTYIENS